MPYSTSAGQESGTIPWRDRCVALGVREAPGAYSAIGTAMDGGPGEGGVHLLRPIVHGAERPGRRVVIDRAFRPGIGPPSRGATDEGDDPRGAAESGRPGADASSSRREAPGSIGARRSP